MTLQHALMGSRQPASRIVRIGLLFCVLAGAQMPRQSQASDGVALTIDATSQRMTVTTSRRLNYGILPADAFRRGAALDLLKNTKMVDPQNAFFDIDKLSLNEWSAGATFASLTTASSDFSLTSLGYADLPREYMLYTEFDRFSRPAIYNYATATGMVLSVAAGSAAGTKLSKSVAKVVDVLGELGKTARTVVDTSVQTLEVSGEVLDAYEVLLALSRNSGVSVPSDYDAVAHALRRAHGNVNTAVTRVAAFVKVVDEISGTAGSMATDTRGRPLSTYTGFQGGGASARSLMRNVVGLFRFKGNLARFEAISDNAVLRQTVLEIMFESMLAPFSHAGEFYYPKAGSELQGYDAVLASPASFDKVSIKVLARTLVRFVEGHRLGKTVNASNVDVAARRQIDMAALALFTSAGREQMERLRAFVEELGAIGAALQVIEATGSALDNLTADQVMLYANAIVRAAGAQLDEFLADALEKLAVRLASYAIPGAGWAKLAADLANAGNTVGAFAYDTFTAPRQIPFVITGTRGRKVEVYKPFAVNLSKLSLFRYPQGQVNARDPGQIGAHTYDSYFLDGNVASADFEGWNVNNRNVSLLANGAAYSYDLVLGSPSAGAFQDLLTHRGNFDRGIYALDFAVKKYRADDLSGAPQVFTSKLTGVVNEENVVLEEGFFNGSWLPSLVKDQFLLCKYSASARSSDCAERGSDPLLAKALGRLNTGDYHYLSFKHAFSTALEERYGPVFSASYGADAGIVHVTPGIYTVDLGLAVRSPKGTRTASGAAVTSSTDTRFEDRQTVFVLASVSAGNANERHIASQAAFTPEIIPYMDGIAFEHEQSSGSCYLLFSLRERARFTRPLRFALASKLTADWAGATGFSFYTLTPGTPADSAGRYRVPVACHYIEFDGGAPRVKASARLIWYDALLAKYISYTGGDEAVLLRRLLQRNSITTDSSKPDAVTKIIHARHNEARTWPLSVVGAKPQLIESSGVPVLMIGVPSLEAAGFESYSGLLLVRGGENLILQPENDPRRTDYRDWTGARVSVLVVRTEGDPCNSGKDACWLDATVDAEGRLRVTMLGNGRVRLDRLSALLATGARQQLSYQAFAVNQSISTAQAVDPGQVGTRPLNDTGVTRFTDGLAGNLANEPPTLAGQDGRFGRDAQAGAGQLKKIGGGAKGFDFTKIANDGTSLAAGAVQSDAPGGWGCTRDNVTGLLWEVRTAAGLRAKTHTYTWFSSDSSTNGSLGSGAMGTSSGGVCASSGRCDTEKYVADVNAQGLCGHRDWRMPSKEELFSIAALDRAMPSIDINYFPDTIVGNYWTGAPGLTGLDMKFWYVSFLFGYVYNGNSSDAIRFGDGTGRETYSVRLVRGGR